MAKPGRLYQHYKGGKYKVLAVGTHTETGETMVTYLGVGEGGRVWIRPLDMWNEEVDGEPRFRELEC